MRGAWRKRETQGSRSSIHRHAARPPRPASERGEQLSRENRRGETRPFAGLGLTHSSPSTIYPVTSGGRATMPSDVAGLRATEAVVAEMG